MADSAVKKVLKTLVIRDGKVVEERLIKPGQGVTVGAAAKNTFVLPDDKLPSDSFLLFEPTREGYRLRFTGTTKGKLSTASFRGSLRKAKKHPSVRRDGEIYSVLLGEDDKGSVEIGDGAVWFKFEAPPAIAPTQVVKSLEEMDFRPVLFERDDPVFLGWLAIWCALGAILLLWVWNTEVSEVEFDEIPDRFTKVVLKEEPKEVEIEAVEDPNAEGASRRKEEKAAKAKPKKEESVIDRAKRREAAKKSALQKSQLIASLIATTGESRGGMVENMWGDGNAGIADIDGVLGEVDGVAVDGAPTLRKGRGGDGEAAGIGELGGVEGGSASVGAGPKVQAKPKVGIGEGSMDADIGDSASASAVVKRNYGALRYCYERELRTNSSLEGRVEIGWSVYGGKVEGVYVISNSTGSKALEDCIVKRIERWTFDDGVEGDMSWPFVFRTE